MVRIGAIVLNVSDRHRAAAFWSQALGYEAEANPDFLVPVEEHVPRLHLDDQDHTHLDLWTADEEEQHGEVERLLSLGARRVVLSDPDDNLFCVINTGAAEDGQAAQPPS